jgi:hypothetical protein
MKSCKGWQCHCIFRQEVRSCLKKLYQLSGFSGGIFRIISAVPSGVVFLGDDTIGIQSHDMGESAVHIGDFAGDSGSQV